MSVAAQRTRAGVLEATREAESTMHPQKVPVNVYETDRAVVLVAPMPAVQPDQVVVELKGRTLRFFATLRSAAPKNYLIQEWYYGGYEREIDVPAGFGSDVEAVLHNGQLVVRVLRGEPTGDRVVQPGSVMVIGT